MKENILLTIHNGQALLRDLAPNSQRFVTMIDILDDLRVIHLFYVDHEGEYRIAL